MVFVQSLFFFFLGWIGRIIQRPPSPSVTQTKRRPTTLAKIRKNRQSRSFDNNSIDLPWIWIRPIKGLILVTKHFAYCSYCLQHITEDKHHLAHPQKKASRIKSRIPTCLRHNLGHNVRFLSDNVNTIIFIKINCKFILIYMLLLHPHRDYACDFVFPQSSGK